MWAFVYLALLGGFLAAACTLPGKLIGSWTNSEDSSSYFTETPAIWPLAEIPTGHQVALFRQRFTNDTALEQAHLHIFADTRYDIWLDGQWLGRGPARFARHYREVDIYPLDKLPPGEHLLAVRVQWAPNLRRSESIRPLLKTYIETQNGRRIAISGNTWKSVLSDAWRSNAALVHAWMLIGPTELLDLRLLPKDWYLPQYDDQKWPPSVIVSESDTSDTAMEQTSPDDDVEQVLYAPRSIPFLENTPVETALIETGLLSPGFLMGELPPGSPVPSALPFSTAETLTLTVETLSNTLTAEAVRPIQIDGQTLDWQPAGPHRPDVVTASLPIPAGSHEIHFDSLPIDGMTFSVGAGGMFENFPFQQSAHAGRRLLLSKPEPDWKVSQLSVLPTPDTQPLQIEFATLPAYAIIDLGRTTHGRLQAEINGAPGTIIDIGWDERLTPEGRPLPYPGSLHPEWNQVDSWIMDGASRPISTIDARAGRYILIAAWGEGPVKVENIQVYEESYPVVQNGSFQTAIAQENTGGEDAENALLLDRIWQVGVDTLRATMTDAYMDTPWRERGQWWGDVYVEERVNQAVFGDTQLVRRGILLMAEAMQTDPAPGMATNNAGLHMLDYSMLWVHSLAEYTLRTGDLSLARQVHPTLLLFMQHLEHSENPNSRLLDLPKVDWSQTAYLDTAGGNNRFGQSAALNSLYYATLLQAAQIANQLGDTDSAQVWRDKASIVKTNLNALLYLPSEGRYLTTIQAGESYEPTPHAQAWPLAYGVVPPEQTDAVVSSLLEMLSPDPAAANLQVYGMYWVLEALGQSGHIAEGVSLIENYYGYMLEAGATTWWEHFNANQFQWSSLSHGWGSSPTWFLTTYVLGARQAGPHDWSLQPAVLVVEQAAGALPLGPDPTQVLQIQWEYSACDQADLRVEAPAQSQGVLWLPYTSAEMQITLDGGAIWKDGAPQGTPAAEVKLVQDSQMGDRIRIPLSEGPHQLSVQGFISPAGCGTSGH